MCWCVWVAPLRYPAFQINIGFNDDVDDSDDGEDGDDDDEDDDDDDPPFAAASCSETHARNHSADTER